MKMTERLTKRMQKQWIVERSEQPSGTRSVAMMFKDPVGTTAESLITQQVAEMYAWVTHQSMQVVQTM